MDMRLLIVISLFLRAGIAGASDFVALESYGTEPPADANSPLTTLYYELTRLGVASPTQFATQLQERVSRPSKTLGDTDVAAITQQVHDGYDNDWLNGRFEPALEKLRDAVTRLQASPATFASDQSRRRLTLKALTGIALAHKRLGNGEASAQAIAELIRSFPDRNVNRTLFGPEAHDLYRRVKHDLGQQETGSLRVTVDDRDTLVFINERFAGTGEISESKLFPGRYRVYVTKG